jgi:preprotein translocase subunit SecD
MQKNITTKTIIIVGVLLAFLYGIFFGVDPAKSYQAMKQGGILAGIQENIHLGLDLKGGTHLILQVAVEEAVNAETNRDMETLKAKLDTGKVAYSAIVKPEKPESIVVRGVNPDKVSDFRRVVSDTFPNYDLSSGAENSYTLSLKAQKADEIRHRAVQQAIETIRGRVDALGVSEPTIQEHGLGDWQILVELPGIDDSARVRTIIQSTAMLEIRQAFSGPYPDEQAAIAASPGGLPANAMLMHGHTQIGPDSPDEVYVISRTAAVSGSDVRDAQPSHDENGRPEVQFNLTNEGGRRFHDFTSQHIGDKLAVVLDNQVREVATIEGAIRDNGRIMGGFSETSAKDLGMLLRSGALPASIHYLQESTVGPSLGADSIRAGVLAAVVGMAAVMVFMLFYYRAAGINADLALVLNLVILLGFLGFSQAVLTLPGIAGVILTIGMGVDSNVLIFERIREELRAGKSQAAAVDQGFGRAWITIVDTHVTTIVSAIILFIFGTGPVRGFAVTLSFGLFANLFTAVFVSRVIFDAVLSRHRGSEQALSI